MSETILRFSSISKSFPGVKALTDISFDLRKGEVLALMGENGAGKSTLMKVLTGINKPDSGSIIYDGKEYTSFDIKEAQDLGISMIYQELNLIPYLSAAENIFLGREFKKNNMVDFSKMNEEATKLFEQLGVQIDPKVKVKQLSIAYQQIIEVAKTVSKKVKVLIMDEPTAPLTNEEVALLFKLVRKLKEEGVSIIYISHRMEEIFALCDRVTVMRDGQYIGTKEIADTTKDELIKMMVGRDIKNQYPPRLEVVNSKKTKLKVENIVTNKLKNVSIEVKEGEIVGIGGLVGAGRTELLRAVFGADAKQFGTVSLSNGAIQINQPADAIQNGIVLVPEDRKHQGLLLNMSVRDNIVLPVLPALRKGLTLHVPTILKNVKELIEKLKIKTPNEKQIVKNLSGGNQQKIVIAKWMLSNADIIMFDEPTRGIDVGAKYEIYTLMNELKSMGKSIIMVSSDMPELVGMSDRIYVMCEGKITGCLEKEEINQEKIMELASNF